MSLALLIGVIPAQAELVQVDPGKIARGRLIIGTGQNLPSLDSKTTYTAGPGFAAQLNRYYRSGRAKRDQRQVSHAAMRAVRQWIESNCAGTRRRAVKDCRAMVVFDIDDTLLNNYRFYSTTSPAFSLDPTGYNAWVASCGSPANVPVRKLFLKLRDLGVRLALITGRRETQRRATKDCLTRRGITGWQSLRLRSAYEETLSAAVYKARARRALHARGFHIIASVGDQVSDMANGHFKYGFLLPNLFRYIP
ncbi:MAG: HAD family acid phosphatase [Candidatus Nanopelagicales bacterium]|nr:HAD family acid phosphatase [Candidatus Nanopelagicales bacterium]